MRLAGPWFRENGECPYLPDRAWAADYLLAMGDLEIAPRQTVPLQQSTFDDPQARFEEGRAAAATEAADGLEVFARLLAAGFRRSGQAFYRPSCNGCEACVSLRVDVRRFQASGDQRRALRKNRDVTMEIAIPSYSDEKLEMYRAFVTRRYPDHQDVTRAGYESFFLDHLGNTREFRYFVDHRLVGVGIVDLVRDAASSVYFFFDPAESSRSLGTYSALREIDFCRQTDRPWLYMGFRVADCAAMRYKSNYRPHQLLDPRRGWIAEAEAATDDSQ